jgi:4-amino-4-deoxy-L-arabinose transferase-like glycosyltransferase
VAFALARPVLLTNDGLVYMEMARSMTHGSVEIANGLDVVDSPELWILHTFKRGAHIYSKYPPLYGVLAAAPYALLGVRGLYLLNALSFVATVLGAYALLLRMFDGRRALVAAALLPLAVPVAPYMMCEMPHALSIALVVWAIVLWDKSEQAAGARSTIGWGIAAGIVAGFASGVRVTNIVVVAPLFVVPLLASSRRRITPVAAMAAGIAPCILAIACINLRRFGSPNPFTYGPPGASVLEETSGLLLRGTVLVTLGLLAVVVLAVRGFPAKTAVAFALAACLSIAAIPPVRAEVVHMAKTLVSLLVNANAWGPGWSVPFMMGVFMCKPLLVSAPCLVLGLLGTLRCAMRPAPALHTALAWVSLALLLSLALRDPDPNTTNGVIGWFSLNPRAMADVMVPIYLLGWYLLRDVPVSAASIVGLGLAAVAWTALFANAVGDEDPLKQIILMYGSLTMAAVVAVTYAARRAPAARSIFGAVAALATGYATGCIVGEDAHYMMAAAEIHARWGEAILAKMPEHVVLAGWLFAKDAIEYTRSRRDMVVADVSVDDGRALADTLDPLMARGRVPFYFGGGFDRVLPHLEGRYTATPVLTDPLLWRLDPVAPGIGRR